MERYYTGDIEKRTYTYDEQPNDLWDTLCSRFQWVRRDDYFSISEPIFHPIINENVITCFLPSGSLSEEFEHAWLARKFCMESGTSFLRIYRLLHEKPVWLPPMARIIASGTNHSELCRPFPSIASTFSDYYFSGNPEEIEEYFGLEKRRGLYATYYGATVVGDEIRRIKQYCYDSEHIFSEWE